MPKRKEKKTLGRIINTRMIDEQTQDRERRWKTVYVESPQDEARVDAALKKLTKTVPTLDYDPDWEDV